ncbi:acyltransferase family protein [Cronobacter turicensis]
MSKGRLDSIQVLRGVAAMLVVLFHFRHYLNDVYPLKDLGDRLFLFGEAGVDIFFVISGFIIVYSSRNREKNTFSEFAIKRFFRLYPLYFVVLSAYLLSYHDEAFNYIDVIKSYLLIPIDYNGKAPWFGLSTIYSAWTLTYESYFYFVFALSILLSHKYRVAICSAVIIVVMYVVQENLYGEFSLVAVTGKNEFSGLIYNFMFVSSPLILDFVMGMVVAYIYVFYEKHVKANEVITFLSLIVLTVSVIFMVSHATASIGPLFWGWCSVGIVISILIISKNLNINYPKFLIYFGEMSYSIYINHVVVKKVSLSYIGPLGLFKSGDGAVILFCLVVATLCMSYGTYNFIEKPSIKLGHRLAEHIRKNCLRREKEESIA